MLTLQQVHKNDYREVYSVTEYTQAITILLIRHFMLLLILSSSVDDVLFRKGPNVSLQIFRSLFQGTVKGSSTKIMEAS